MNVHEFAELAAGHALGALDETDRAAFEAALVEHPEWSGILELDAATVDALADSVTPVAPPLAARGALLSKIMSLPQEGAEAAPAADAPELTIPPMPPLPVVPPMPAPPLLRPPAPVPAVPVEAPPALSEDLPQTVSADLPPALSDEHPPASPIADVDDVDAAPTEAIAIEAEPPVTAVYTVDDAALAEAHDEPAAASASDDQAPTETSALDPGPAATETFAIDPADLGPTVPGPATQLNELDPALFERARPARESDAPEPPVTTASIQAVSRRNWTRGLFTLAASLVILVVLGYGAVNLNEWVNRPPAVVALQEIEQAPDAQSATVEVTGGSGVATAHWSGSLGKAVLVTDGLPTVAEGETFELWFVREDGTPVSAGTFDAEGSTATTLLAGDMHTGDTIAVTVEQAGGSTSGAPTTDPIVAIPTA